MKEFFKKIYFWCYIKIHSILINISIALYNTEIEILKADPNDLNESNKRIQRMLHRNPLLEKFYAGKRDEVYVNSYYELLKKADKFIRTATSHKIAVAADKHTINYGKNDQYGRQYEHYGFFDEKHKHAGKTLEEVLSLELEERKTKDDNYELLYIFNNKPIEAGFSKIMNTVEKTEKENVDYEYEVLDNQKKSKSFVFPIKIYRDTNENVVNKIEQLAEFLHVKKIGLEYRMLEFFIPLKFKTIELNENSEIFKEILNIKGVYIKDQYGELKGFSVIKYMKRIKHNDMYDVIIFEGIEMETVKI